MVYVRARRKGAGLGTGRHFIVLYKAWVGVYVLALAWRGCKSSRIDVATFGRVDVLVAWEMTAPESKMHPSVHPVFAALGGGGSSGRRPLSASRNL